MTWFDAMKLLENDRGLRLIRSTNSRQLLTTAQGQGSQYAQCALDRGGVTLLRALDNPANDCGIALKDLQNR